MPDVIWRGFSSTFFFILAKESLNLGNTNALNNLSLQGAKRRSYPKKNEIAAPFGLAMTWKKT